MECIEEPFICSFDGCKKICKSKGGLKIHSRVHMPSLLNKKVQTFDINKLKVIIKGAEATCVKIATEMKKRSRLKEMSDFNVL